MIKSTQVDFFVAIVKERQMIIMDNEMKVAGVYICVSTEDKSNEILAKINNTKPKII